MVTQTIIDPQKSVSTVKTTDRAMSIKVAILRSSTLEIQAISREMEIARVKAIKVVTVTETLTEETTKIK